MEKWLDVGLGRNNCLLVIRYRLKIGQLTYEVLARQLGLELSDLEAWLQREDWPETEVMRLAKVIGLSDSQLSDCNLWRKLYPSEQLAAPPIPDHKAARPSEKVEMSQDGPL
jgi:hypothetical protein